MTHHHMSRILYVTLVAVFMTAGLAIFAYSETLPTQAVQVTQSIVVYCVSPSATSVYEISSSNSQAPCQYSLAVVYQNVDLSPQVLGAATYKADSSTQAPSSHLSWNQATQKYVLGN
jgi:hypothetical protein